MPMLWIIWQNLRFIWSCTLHLCVRHFYTPLCEWSSLYDKMLFKSLSFKTISKKKSHSIVGWSTATFRHNPVDVLARVLDIAGLTVDTVLGVYLQSHPISSFQRHILVYTWEGWWREKVNLGNGCITRDVKHFLSFCVLIKIFSF